MIKHPMELTDIVSRVVLNMFGVPVASRFLVSLQTGLMIAIQRDDFEEIFQQAGRVFGSATQGLGCLYKPPVHHLFGGSFPQLPTSPGFGGPGLGVPFMGGGMPGIGGMGGFGGSSSGRAAADSASRQLQELQQTVHEMMDNNGSVPMPEIAGLQEDLNSSTQMVQMISKIMQNQHNIASAIIGNMPDRGGGFSIDTTSTPVPVKEAAPVPEEAERRDTSTPAVQDAKPQSSSVPVPAQTAVYSGDVSFDEVALPPSAPAPVPASAPVREALPVQKKPRPKKAAPKQAKKKTPSVSAKQQVTKSTQEIAEAGEEIVEREDILVEQTVVHYQHLPEDILVEQTVVHPLFSEELASKSEESTSELSEPTSESPVERKERTEKVLRRKGVVRSYSQMNPGLIFPLLVSIVEAELYIKIPDLPQIQQVESDRVMEIKESSPYVRIVPVLPGCLISPPEIVVDVRAKKVDAEFRVAPQAEGDLGEFARIQLWHEGVLKDEIPIPCQVRTQTLTRIASYSSVITALSGATLETYGKHFSTLNSEGQGTTGVVAYMLQKLIVLLTSSGIWLGLFFLLTAILCYLWLRPKQGDVIEKFLTTELH